MIQKTKFKDLFLIKNTAHKDQRGYFKELIRENKLNKKVYNMAVSSYGSVREIKKLKLSPFYENSDIIIISRVESCRLL